MAPPDAPEADWLAFSRRAAEASRTALERFPLTAQRAEKLGRGEGGDMTLAIDGAVEDAVFAELESLGVGLCAVSEERGLVEIAGGGPARVVIDPIDGSLNAKRRLPFYSLSIAVADGDDMASVSFGYVTNFPTGEEWWALRGGGAFFGGERLEAAGPDTPLEILGVESAHPWMVAAGAEAIASTEAHRLRMIGSIALSLCFVASARFDAMLCLRPARSVDAAAGQLVVREAGGSVAFPDAGGPDPLGAGLGLDMRSRVFAGATTSILEGLLAAGLKVEA
ncbi:MAG: monophosphatase [Thermoleophilaceae bacterium]|jgi:myo-inositol-1(or 4)-monophosphatase|nr:monophosphatase [Thermoleophilaceae bacterium]